MELLFLFIAKVAKEGLDSDRQVCFSVMSAMLFFFVFRTADGSKVNAFFLCSYAVSFVCSFLGNRSDVI